MKRLKVKTRRKIVFIKKILNSPSVLINTFLVILTYRLRKRRALGQPLVVDIEPTNACNFRCPHCQVTSADWVRKSLSEDDFNKYLKLFSKALRIKLQGMGEPFLNKNLISYIKKTSETGSWCEVTSNASLFDKVKLEELSGIANFQLTVSIDAADPEVFHSMRPGSDFEGITKNVDAAINEKGIPLAAWMVVTTENRELIPDVVDYTAGLGFTDLGLQMVVVDYGKEELEQKTVDKRVDVIASDLVLPDIKSKAEKKNLALEVSDRLYSKESPCPWPWYGVFVDVTGNIVPCCRIGDAEVVNMGNVNEQSFNEIWNSTKYQNFREQHAVGKIPKYCRSCYQ